jgi:hypothetical protein
MDMGRKKKIKVTPEEMVLSKREIEQGVKALLGQYYFGNEGYFRVVNTADPAVLKAVALLEQQK